MAPSTPNFHSMLLKRQDSTNSTASGSSDPSAGVPACVVTCMASAPISGCKGSDDWTCLCASTEFINSVGACWTSSCSASDAAYGQAYANQACAFYGVPIGGNSTSSSGSPTDTQVTGTPLLTAPEVSTHSFIKVQAIMSSITSLLLAMAVILGILSCRQRYKRDQAASQNRTWNGVTGLTTMDSKAPTSKSRFFSSNKSQHSSAFGNSRNMTSTFQSENFGVTSSNFGGSTTLAGSPTHLKSFTDNNGENSINGGAGGIKYPSMVASIESDTGKRFTNRLAYDQSNKSEEWELSNLKRDNVDELDGFEKSSPTSFDDDSKMESEMESRLNNNHDNRDQAIDSTVNLNILPKNGPGSNHAL
ncbi:uncharacterized protein L201_001717 [Kwoniella dendrophila CBS 6074]|uniref:CFEM domain-containing protein n=1 Tax=Kwoniella dendrophila CBS 6074 TaxID=1295534 RepID=A0AAX4JPM9_9TREE